MKYIQIVIVSLFIIVLQSCDSACGDVTCMNNGVCVEGICDCPEGFTGSDCGVACSDRIFGTWTVTDIRPVGCTVVSYKIGAGMSPSILSISIDDGTRTLDGQGLLNADCDEMTYTVSAGGIIVSGAIEFDGAMFIDQSRLGCLIYAEKQ